MFQANSTTAKTKVRDRKEYILKHTVQQTVTNPMLLAPRISNLAVAIADTGFIPSARATVTANRLK